MKTLKLYKTVILQAVLLFIGLLLIVSNLLAADSVPNTKVLSTINIIDCEMEPEIEAWMFELDSWKTSTNLTLITESNNSIKQEDQILLEDWMLHSNSKFWSIRNINELETDEEIALEEWMTDPELLLTSL